MTRAEILADLAASLPPLVTRVELQRATGGAIKVGTLANLDSRGEGPADRMTLCGKAVYPRAAAVAWIAARLHSVEQEPPDAGSSEA